jgi:hypothetical protein
MPGQKDALSPKETWDGAINTADWLFETGVARCVWEQV